MSKNFLLDEPQEFEFSESSKHDSINNEDDKETKCENYLRYTLQQDVYSHNKEVKERKHKKKQKKLKKKHSKLKKKYKKLRNELSACKVRLDEVEKSREYQMKLFFNNGQCVSCRKEDNND